MKKLVLFVGDVVIFYASLFLALFLRYGKDYTYWLDSHVISFSVLLIFWALIFYINGLYEIRTSKNTVEFYSALSRATVLNVIVSVLFFYLIPFFSITPKRNLFILTLIFIVFILVWRLIFNKIISALTFKNNIIIVGFNQSSIELARFLKANPQLGYSLKYIADLTPEFRASPEDWFDFGIIKSPDRLKHVLEHEKIRIVVLSPEFYKVPGITNIFYKYINKKIEFLNLSKFYEILTYKVPLDAIDQTWFLENLKEGKRKFYEILKRLTDILLSIVFGAISLILYPFIILAIKLDSKGNIFFKQKRVGRGGEVFEIIKFRTMIENAEKNTGPVWAKESDSRITRIGKILRKTRIDELPQFWNVLKGQMSFVGPRAERPEFHEQLKKEIVFYEERYLIKPGLTGWAQIQYPYVASIADTKQKLQYDLYYIKNRSFALDITIILKTISIILRGWGR